MLVCQRIPPHPMLNDPKGFCKHSISHTSKNLQVYESCIPSKTQEQLNCKEVYSIIQVRTYFMLTNWITLCSISFLGHLSDLNSRFWYWKNRSVFSSMRNPNKLHILLLKICEDLAGNYIAQVSLTKWRSSDKQLGATYCWLTPYTSDTEEDITQGFLCV